MKDGVAQMISRNVRTPSVNLINFTYGLLFMIVKVSSPFTE